MNLLHHRHDSFEGFGTLVGDFGKHFAVDVHAFLFHGADELAVGRVVFAEGAVQTNIPKAAHVAFFVSAMGKSIRTSVGNGFVGLAFFRAATVSVAFDLLEHISSGFEGVNAFFYSCHIF